MIMRLEAFRRVFAPNGTILESGQNCSRLDLMHTLEMISENGPDALYDGPIGESLLNDVKEAGGVWEASDLSGYTVHVCTKYIPTFKEIPTVSTSFMGLEVISGYPTTGGPLLMLILNILEGLELGKLGYGVQSMHWVIEAFKFAFSDKRALVYYCLCSWE